MPKIIVSGGCGYIGSHTLVDLVSHGYEVISIDNLSRAFKETLDGVKRITGKNIKNYEVDLCDREATLQLFAEHTDASGIIHFAAYKSVPESVEVPLLYYQNNLNALVNILYAAQKFQVNKFVFSSSCAVYGNTSQLPVLETTPFEKAESPYGRTKQMGEAICEDFSKVNPAHQLVLLRYFNPVGAHESALIGDRNKRKENLVPIITEAASGLRPSMTVYGTDYDTRDGYCIRDYIHVMDIAHAHTLAIEKALNGKINNSCEVYNLGTGNGVSVLELLAAFERVSGQKLNYTLGERRMGDVGKIYADSAKAEQELGWVPQFDIDEMMRTAWNWQLQMNQM